MDAGLHLPLIDFAGEGISSRRLDEAVDAAREFQFTAISANDHFLFSRPWLDGPTALAATLQRSGDMTLATTVALTTLRGPVPLAKSLAALDILSGGRLIAGLGPGSSRRDFDAVGVPFEERWPRFEEAVTLVRALLAGAVPAAPRYHPAPEAALAPRPSRGRIPLWIGSWGSPAGLRRVARLADGWLVSAYNATPESFARGLAILRAELARRDRLDPAFPHALVTMWTWVTDDRGDAERVLCDVLAPMLDRDPTTLRGRVCVGPADMCAELLSGYARAGCHRVYFWPIGAERRQVELIATQVLPQVAP